ncbi:hypothetical protein U1P98_05460 [Lysinibacillus irui]|uniref:Lipoprotein n=1 Tax=Lysinibacillus irui TaxID=2998077 RepID=A0AAJ5RR35_9BACI|nr:MULTISPECIES: hypothetical protein [Lysinibacillus]MEA0553159.1 hypothetical protein [Lysinibacillus irui]MEA0562576.1 hypothetical protein [Lysinibacillus irui]MEA0975739.1 hypothetical protein [Lysinibacillus irui]MEA1041893.1 hypothetical protein [Lysinibacillus irui]WDV08947.1 hypothetical protein OU989_10890 [Lysinibacillus irui]
MKSKKYFYGLIVLALFMITGCNIQGGTTTVTNDSIDAEEVLTLDSNADIFQYKGVIYKANIDWVEKLSLTKDVQVSEIKTKNDTGTNFKDEMSNKLPVGAKIFSTKEREDILIIESEGEIKKYLAIVEG